MQNHKQTDPWFSSIIGFFYQFGVSCDIDKNQALKLYLLTVSINEKESLDKNFIYLRSLEVNDDFSLLKILMLLLENICYHYSIIKILFQMKWN